MFVEFRVGEKKKMASFASPLIFMVMLFAAAIVVSVESIPVFVPGSYQASLKKKVKNVEKKSIQYKAHYFPQILDHFNFHPKSYKIFYQKYLIQRKYWQKGGSIFVYAGNEGDIDWFAANTGFMLDIAPQFQALLVFIEVKIDSFIFFCWTCYIYNNQENISPHFFFLGHMISQHRFYGESLPFGNKSASSAETLGYLSSQQALADYAVLIRSLKQNLSSEASPVVVFGGSYGGSM